MDTTRPGVTVLGTGSWGTTLAILCARQGARVTLLTRDAGEAAQLRADGENRRFLPGHPFPPNLRVAHQSAEGLVDCQVFLFVVPSQTMRANVERVTARLRSGVPARAPAPR